MKARRAPNARSLKLFCLLLCCVLASVMFVSRFKADAGSTAPTRSLASSETVPTENHPPEMAEVRYKRVGVGQRIFFGLSVIDEEADDVRVEMTRKPASSSSRPARVRRVASAIAACI